MASGFRDGLRARWGKNDNCGVYSGASLASSSADRRRCDLVAGVWRVIRMELLQPLLALTRLFLFRQPPPPQSHSPYPPNEHSGSSEREERIILCRMQEVSKSRLFRSPTRDSNQDLRGAPRSKLKCDRCAVIETLSCFRSCSAHRDRAFPCQSCIRRGCAAICPDGAFPTWYPESERALTQPLSQALWPPRKGISRLHGALIVRCVV